MCSQFPPQRQEYCLSSLLPLFIERASCPIVDNLFTSCRFCADASGQLVSRANVAPASPAAIQSPGCRLASRARLALPAGTLALLSEAWLIGEMGRGDREASSLAARLKRDSLGRTRRHLQAVFLH